MRVFFDWQMALSATFRRQPIFGRGLPYILSNDRGRFSPAENRLFLSAFLPRYARTKPKMPPRIVGNNVQLLATVPKGSEVEYNR
ncbi:MAG: hypothetical protein Q8P37_00365, partial [Candidatus Spechtbacteria bacterium]|nr:hypothetical protein [Candidatus Spechtbacteria bacterium]